MATVAIIGPDGAGKTTVARRVLSAAERPTRYLYMGINTSSSNVALPTSRLVERLKPRADRSGGVPPSGADPGRSRSPGRVWRTARLVNRVAEAWFRQVVSWSWELRGYLVVYDRHFMFDFAELPGETQPELFDRRAYRWILTHLYPRPDLVLFLDAPGTVLFDRKGESTPEELERRRQGMLRAGRSLDGFIRLDATQPLDEVCAEVSAHVQALASGGSGAR